MTFTATADGQAAAGLALAPATGSSTNFGNVLVGSNVVETYVLTNTGQQATTAVTVTLTTTTGSGFALVAPTTGECVTGTTVLAGQASCTIRVRFTAAAAGAQTATLAATATTGGTATPLPLTANGRRPAVLSGTTTNNFGTVVVGATSAAFTWTITNTGDVATGVPALTNSNQTELIVGTNTCTVAVAGGGTCTIGASFRPSAAGARTGTLTLAATPGGSVTLTASATGQSPRGPVAGAREPARRRASATSWSAPPATETFVLTNTGQQTTTAVTVALTTAASSGFAVVAPTTGDCTTGTTLAGGASCNIHVKFTAPGAGLQTATLGATATTGGTAAALSLSGNGQRPAALSGTTTNSFGTVVVGATSGAFTWTISNTGDAATGVPALTNGNTGRAHRRSQQLHRGHSRWRPVHDQRLLPPVGGGGAQRDVVAGRLSGRHGDPDRQRHRTDRCGVGPGARDRILDELRQRAGRIDGDAGLRADQLRPASDDGGDGVADHRRGLWVRARAPAAGDCPSTAGAARGRRQLHHPCEVHAAGRGAADRDAGRDRQPSAGPLPGLSLSGNGQRPAVLTGTSSNNFGTVAVGDDQRQRDLDRDQRRRRSDGHPALTNGDPGEVLVGANTCTAAIAAGASCTIAVSFSATAAGARSGMLTLAATPGGSVTFTASANGQTAAGLALGARGRILDQLWQRAGGGCGDASLRAHQHRPADDGSGRR